MGTRKERVAVFAPDREICRSTKEVAEQGTLELLRRWMEVERERAEGPAAHADLLP